MAAPRGPAKNPTEPHNKRPRTESSPYTMYITLQFLREVRQENKYHWGIYVTQDKPPNGYLVHATDMNRRPLDLYQEIREVSDPLKSKTMTACIKLGRAPAIEDIRAVASRVRLMDPRYLPRGEVQWTCRVWVKEVLAKLHAYRLVTLPASVDRIEAYGVRAANDLREEGIAGLINNLSWIQPPTVPMQVDPRPRYYGPSLMETQVSRGGHFGTTPVVNEAHRPREQVVVARRGYYGPSPMVTEAHRPRERVVEARRPAYYGPSPMDTEIHAPREQIVYRRNNYAQRPAAPEPAYRYVNVVRR